MPPGGRLETVVRSIVATPNHRSPRRVALRIPYITVAAFAAVVAASADALQPDPAPQNAKAEKGEAWVPPGTPGSPIDGELFHAQVLMSAHGFSPGVIDGKEGESFKLALRSFQEARGLERTGKL